MSMLLKNLFDYLFKKRSLVFLGRAGLNCYYNREKFFIDSEMLVGASSDIVIYSDRIYLIKSGEKYAVDENTRINVLAFLKSELKKQKIKFEISLCTL
jgi:hypothetical protein